ncbi:MAG: DUF1549 domain-containing protein [Bryobacteraceae bacterium]
MTARAGAAILLAGALTLAAPGESGRVNRKNLIDEHIFEKMEKDGVPHAPLSSDTEFLRRVTLDLTGRLPSPETIRKFAADSDPGKRDKYIDTLFPLLPTMGVGRRPTRVGPFLDRWTTFFGDMFRNNEQLREGINSFHDYIYKVLELNVPYDEFVREMITASAVSTWTTGPANFVARHRVMAGDGYSEMNHEDTADELAIWTTRLFLGVDIECISCHDGRGHLEKVNLWLARKKRADVWRQAAFFGKTFVAPVYGRIPEFRVNDSEKGYDLATKSVTRLPRYKANIHPAFLLTDEKYQPAAGESEREAYARLLAAHPQFARATVNLFWAELMGRGIVDPPFGFDLDRQDPANPPPAPWTIQPTHPELLNALAEDFRKHRYDLRRLMKLIVTSSAYQLSSYYPGEWKAGYENYFARHNARRLSAEEFWDALSDATGIHEEFKVKDLDRKFKHVMEAHFNQDFAASHKDVWNLLQEWGQTDREDPPTDRSSMVQAASLLNHELVLNKVKIQKGGRLEKLLRLEPPKTNEEIVEELFLATISRLPAKEERSQSVHLLQQHRDQGAEDLLWALVNRLDFVFCQ